MNVINNFVKGEKDIISFLMKGLKLLAFYKKENIMKNFICNQSFITYRQIVRHFIIYLYSLILIGKNLNNNNNIK